MGESTGRPGATKWCSYQKHTVPITEFWKNRAKPDGLQDLCKECMRLYDKENPKHSRHHARYKPKSDGLYPYRTLQSKNALKRWIAGAEDGEIKFQCQVDGEAVLKRFYQEDVLRLKE